MGKILCATRGGETSYRTQDAVIALAKEQNDSLLFLYVVDMHFLDKVSGSSVVNAKQELIKMGKFLLLMAQERAAKQNIKADTILREGEMHEEVQSVACEEEVSLVVLGEPVGDESIFDLADLKTIAAEIEAETGVEARIV